MVNKSNNKENKPNKYTNEQLNGAIEAVKSGTNPSRPSREYDVPRSTILNHINGVSKSMNVGKPTLFTREEEKLIVDLLIALNGWGFGLGLEDLTLIAHNLAKSLNKKKMIGIQVKTGVMGLESDGNMNCLIDLRAKSTKK